MKRDGDTEYYTREYYRRVLNKLDPEKVVADLGYEAVLLCWEKSGEFCHRHIVAEWLCDKLGTVVLEV